jgi:biopolymer transport protein TolR
MRAVNKKEVAMTLLGSRREIDGDGLFAEINVTPLVDVMLVLLIIFMVTAPFMTERIAVDLPEGKGAEVDVATAPITITIDKDEKIFIAKEAVTLEQLKTFLTDSPRIKNGEAIYIEADEMIRNKALMAVMSQAYLAGARKVNLVMEQP